MFQRNTLGLQMQTAILNDSIDWLDVSGKIANRLKRTFYWLEWDDLVGTASLAVGLANNKYDDNKSPDKNRLASPLVVPSNAIIIDNSHSFNKTIFQINKVLTKIIR